MSLALSTADAELVVGQAPPPGLGDLMLPWITSASAFLHTWCSHRKRFMSPASQHLSGAPLGHGVPGDTFSLGLRAASLWEIKGSAPLFLHKLQLGAQIGLLE